MLTPVSNHKVMGRVAIIPARGGSKRIPRKNIKLFLGKPIIAYSIEAALESDLFDEVMVSTDDSEISEIAMSFGAKVPFLRSDRNSDDYATTIDVISEVIGCYKTSGRSFEQGCCIYPSAPFTTPRRLQEFVHKLSVGKFDCVFPVLKYGYPIQRALRMSGNDQVSMLDPKQITTRSQDLEATYHDAGQFYAFSVKALIDANKLWTDNTSAIEIDELTAQDIDTVDDWEIAEFKYEYLKVRGLL
jgi:pseudaminic acid cytidylyltransferase